MQESHLDSGAYVLHALLPSEEAEFEQVLKNDAQLRYEVIELQDTAVALSALASPQMPPAGLKSNIMELLDDTPQKSAQQAVKHSPTKIKVQQRWFNKSVVVTVVGLAAVSVGITALAYQYQVTSPTVESVDLAHVGLAEISAASDRQENHQILPDGTRMNLLWSEELQASTIVYDELQPLEAGKEYQLWYMRLDQVPQYAGTLSQEATSSWKVLDGLLADAQAVAITVEDTGHTSNPTTTPIASFPISS